MEEPGSIVRSVSLSASSFGRIIIGFPTCFDSRFDSCKRIWIKTPIGWDLVRQASLNKLMHSIYGNTTLRIQSKDSDLQAVAVLKLDNLIPPNNQPAFQYSRDLLLSFRNPDTVAESHILTTTQFHSTSSSAKPCFRTGRRRKILLPSGDFFFKKTKRRGIHRIHEFTHQTGQLPPPRGAPGAPRSHEECPHGLGTQGMSRGAVRRRLQRRAYCRWLRHAKQDRVKGVGPPRPVPGRPQHAAQSRAAWFRQSLLWQETFRRRKGRKVRNFPTTTPIQYDKGFRFGTLNVQGFADTLKLKNSIQLMEEHKLDVLFLTETKSYSYYSYLSEQYLVILSGNYRQKHAGVGVIIAPRVRPHLLEVIQVNPRLIHVCFKKQGGNIHLLGAYAPHSGLALEEERIPFWDEVEDHISKIPLPEPMFLTGDFNVRFQAKHKHDGGVLGPFVYGKGTRYIDHNSGSNRTLCINFLKRQDMLEVASFRTPNMMSHITYRVKLHPQKTGHSSCWTP